MKAPTAIEKKNLPEDIKFAFNEGVELHQCIQNYELGILTSSDFINDMRKIKEKYERNMER